MSYETEFAQAKFLIAYEIAAYGVVPDQCDAVLCEDDKTISAHVFAGERCFSASITLDHPIDPATFDRREFEVGFLEALTRSLG